MHTSHKNCNPIGWCRPATW